MGAFLSFLPSVEVLARLWWTGEGESGPQRTEGDCGMGAAVGEGTASEAGGGRVLEVLPAMAWLWGPPCSPGNTAELMSDSRLYRISLPVLGSVLRTPG